MTIKSCNRTQDQKPEHDLKYFAKSWSHVGSTLVQTFRVNTWGQRERQTEREREREREREGERESIQVIQVALLNNAFGKQTAPATPFSSRQLK